MVNITRTVSNRNWYSHEISGRNRKHLYSDNTLRVKDLAGYTGYITNTAGSVVFTYVITSSDDVKQ